MFILIQPMYSKQELNADSNYVVYTSWVNALSEIRPDLHFFVVFPDGKSGYKYEPDGFFDKPNVTRIPQRISPRKHANAATFDATWYDTLFRQYGFDIVWCNLVEIAHHIKYCGASTYEESARQTIMAAHNYVIHKTLPYPIESQMNNLLSQLLGASCCDINIFNSNHCYKMLMENAESYLSPSMVEKIKMKSKFINYGVLENDFHPPQREQDIPIIAYNHRLQSYKQYAITFEVLNEIYKEGFKFEVLYLCNTNEMTKKIIKYPFVKVQLCRNREEYLKYLSRCHLNVSNSIHETFCIAAIESMAFGQPLVAPNGITFPEITGRGENSYPYLFNTLEEQKEYLKKMIINREEREKWGEILSKHVKEKFSHRLWAERYLSVMDSLCLRDMEAINPSPDIINACGNLVEKNGMLPIRDLFNKLQSMRFDGKQSVGNQSYPIKKILLLCRKAGCKPIFRNGIQYIKKVV